MHHGAHVWPTYMQFVKDDNEAVTTKLKQWKIMQPWPVNCIWSTADILGHKRHEKSCWPNFYFFSTVSFCLMHSLILLFHLQDSNSWTLTHVSIVKDLVNIQYQQYLQVSSLFTTLRIQNIYLTNHTEQYCSRIIEIHIYSRISLLRPVKRMEECGLHRGVVLLWKLQY